MASSESVTLINPPSPFLYVDREQIPLGLLYIGAVLKENNIDVNILDLAGDEKWEKTVIESDLGDIIGVTATTPHHPIAKKIIELISQHHGKKYYMAGGPHPNIKPEAYLNIGFDIVVRGEGENKIVEIVKNRLKGVLQSGIVENLDALPLPAWDLIDIKSYRQTFLGKKIVHLFTSRGCPYRCAFCSQSVFYRKVRFRSPDKVMDEIYALHYDHGYERLMFMDDTFGAQREYATEIMRRMKPLGILWRCHFRANLCTREMLEMMYDSGCRHITLGIESGSQKILDIIKKGTTVEMNTRAMQLAKDVGLKVKAFTIVGLPGETYETMEATKRWLLDNEPDDFDLQIFHPYEDSDIYQNKQNYDIYFPEDLPYESSWFKGNPTGYVGTSSVTPEQITEWRNRAFEELVRKLKPMRL